MKKIISALLSLIMICSMALTAFAVDFTDFTAAHWSYAYVSELVADGTINGFGDGSFRPEATVTRAEFVKMIGFGSERRGSEFDDVQSSHWAYEYIMTSGLEAATGNEFAPDVPITRGEVVKLLWKRAGSVKGITAPPVVHRQDDNYDAVSWAYTNGIMTGDDNINLRLKDTLTRAEAAALIVRSRNTDALSGTLFMSQIDLNLFETAYNAFSLIDKPYTADGHITNGELALAAARIICDEDKPTYKNISATVSFEHKYAQPLNMLCRYYLGAENDNAVYADKNATVKEVIAALMFAVSRSANSYIPTGDLNVNYPSQSGEPDSELKKLLAIAYNNGIWFDSADSINLDNEITMKEFACLLIEFDGFSGFYTADRLGFESYNKDLKLRCDLSTYPANSSEYRLILADVPNIVYEAPFPSKVSEPKASYNLTNSFKSIFETMLATWIARTDDRGARIAVTYFPGIAVDNGNGYTLRVCIEIESVSGTLRMSDIIKTSGTEVGEKVLSAGDRFYADIETGIKVNDVRLPADNMTLTQIIG